jgi:hypothetical protein
VLSRHDSRAAPQTVQTASPVCGTKNFSSVRRYSAPQLHCTIVAIPGICASDRPFQPRTSATIKLTHYRLPMCHSSGPTHGRRADVSFLAIRTGYALDEEPFALQSANLHDTTIQN